MQERLRFFLFNMNVFNRGLPRVLPELLGEAGGADVLMWNEVTRGLMPKLLGATGQRWSTAEGPSSYFLGAARFRMSIHVREGAALTGLETVESFRVGTAPWRGVARHALVARARWRGGTVLLACVHLSPEMPFVPGARFGVRARQVKALAAQLRRLRQPDEPILLAGDFNYCKHDGREVEQAWAADLLGRELDLVDVARERAGRAPAADTWPSPGHFSAGLGPQRMDLFYLSRSWMPRVRDLVVHAWPWKRSGSDHDAVSLVLDLDGGNA